MQKLSSIKIAMGIFVITFGILVYCNFCGGISMGKEYGPYGFFVITSFCGWLFLWSISLMLKKLRLIGKCLIFLSKESIYVLLFHFCGFKVATCLLILIKNDDWINLSGFPISYKGYSWFYTMMGLLVSVGIAIGIESLKKRFRKEARI